MDLTAHQVIQELVARPGQSKFLLASSLHVPLTLLDPLLDELSEQGLILSNQQYLWAHKDAARLATFSE